MNLCPCGYLGDPNAECGCSADRVANYRSKVSGPLIDRIDLHVAVRRPPKEVLRADAMAEESSRDVARRVLAAREIQMTRCEKNNASLEGAELRRWCGLTKEPLALLERATDKFNLSARAYQRVLRVGRTIADLANEENISAAHVAEALSLRQLDNRRN